MFPIYLPGPSFNKDFLVKSNFSSFAGFPRRLSNSLRFWGKSCRAYKPTSDDICIAWTCKLYVLEKAEKEPRTSGQSLQTKFQQNSTRGNLGLSLPQHFCEFSGLLQVSLWEALIWEKEKIVLINMAVVKPHHQLHKRVQY